MNKFWAALAAVAVVACPLGAVAQEKAAVKPGFVMPTDPKPKILVFRPDVKVGSQSAGGVISSRADWTGDARNYLSDALVAAKPGGASEVVFMPELEGDDALLLAEYRSLFRAVAETVLQHRLFKGNRLPTKKTGFEYTLGPGVAKLGALGAGDYGLFIFTDDAFGSTGRKLLQIFAAGVAGVGVTSGRHIGYAALVDLRTGDLLWINADIRWAAMCATRKALQNACRSCWRTCRSPQWQPANESAPGARSARASAIGDTG